MWSPRRCGDGECSRNGLMKDYLQPAATFALALAIGSLPITLPMAVQAGGSMTVGTAWNDPLEVRVVSGCR